MKDFDIVAGPDYNLYGICPKCRTEFEEPENPSPHGYLCPVCKEHGYSLVGVIHFKPKPEFYGDYI